MGYKNRDYDTQNDEIQQNIEFRRRKKQLSTTKKERGQANKTKFNGEEKPL